MNQLSTSHQVSAETSYNILCKHSSEQSFTRYDVGTVSVEADPSEHEYCQIGPHIHGEHSSEKHYRLHPNSSVRGVIPTQINTMASHPSGWEKPSQKLSQAASDSNQSRTSHAFVATGQLPSFEVLAQQQSTEVNLSCASTPRSEQVYSDASITPEIQHTKPSLAQVSLHFSFQHNFL